jgi:hypothetical protein
MQRRYHQRFNTFLKDLLSSQSLSSPTQTTNTFSDAKTLQGCHFENGFELLYDSTSVFTAMVKQELVYVIYSK